LKAADLASAGKNPSNVAMNSDETGRHLSPEFISGWCRFEPDSATNAVSTGHRESRINPADCIMKYRILSIASIAMLVSTAGLAATAGESDPEAGVKEGAVVIGTAAAGALETELLTSRQAMTRYRQLASQYVSFELMFHTGASGLMPESERRLAQLAQFLAEQPDIDVTLSGHADPRGDDQYNLALTEGRVQTIATLLEVNGVDAARIVRNAFGDRYSLAAEGDFDAYALERRVTIELSVPGLATELASIVH